MHPYWRVILGFAFSMLGGDLVIRPLMGRIWLFLRKHSAVPKDRSTRHGALSLPLGILERGLYTGALMVGAWQVVGAWLVLKTAAKWKKMEEHKGADNAWLIGNGLSLLFGFFGAWIGLWRLPTIR
jgi:hypothetical protein